MAISFTVYGEPAPKGSTKSFPIMKGGKPVLDKKGRPVIVTTADNEKTKPWQELIRAATQKHRPAELYKGAVAITARFYFMRPRSVSEKKRPYHTVKPDLDKLCRSLGDSLKGQIYAEDAQVVKWAIEKHYGDPPRVEVEIREVQP